MKNGRARVVERKGGHHENNDRQTHNSHVSANHTSSGHTSLSLEQTPKTKRQVFGLNMRGRKDGDSARNKTTSRTEN